MPLTTAPYDFTSPNPIPGWFTSVNGSTVRDVPVYPCNVRYLESSPGRKGCKLFFGPGEQQTVPEDRDVILLRIATARTESIRDG